MPVTLLDIILLVVMLISGLLAMIRGFMREVLSIASWGAAAAAAVIGYPMVLPQAKIYFTNEMLASAATIGGIFLATLIVVSMVTIKISDMILDSRVGALDRSLGFLFGLARGLLIVVVAFQFLIWLVPDKGQPGWIANAKSRVVLQSTGDWLRGMLPDDPESTILKKLKKPKPADDGEPADAPPSPRTEAPRASGRDVAGATGADQTGYGRADRQGLQQLLSGGQPRTR